MKLHSVFAKTLILGVFSLFIMSGILNAQVSTAERSALMALYNDTHGASWTNNTNWGTGDPVDTWFGVTVSGNKVTQINLKNNNLDGFIPDEFFNLTNLTFLHLRNNFLSGTISPLIGNLTDLNFLGLNENQFSGPLPSTIGNLTKLTEVYLQKNGFTGDLPILVGSLLDLEYLFCFENHLDNLPSLAALTHLNDLRVQNNNLEFDDLEVNNGIASPTFTYSPQALVGIPSARAEIQGANVTLQANIGGTANTYQWYKNGILLTGETNADLILTNLQPVDAGVYSCKAQNTIITGLTLDYAPTTITVLPYVILTAPAENITAAGADIPYTVNFGGATLTEHGIVYGLNPVPTFADTKMGSGSIANGSFTLNAHHVVQNTTYYACAYAIEGGTPYFGNEISFTTPKIDQPVLEALYNQTTGILWTDNTNWLVDPDLSTWFGITAVSDRVTKIELGNNNLTGQVPDLSTLTQLTDVDLSDNNLQFGDLEANSALIGTMGANFIYASQNEAGLGGTHSVTAGGTVELTETCSGSANVYQWQEEILGTWTNVPGATAASHTFTPADDTKYRLVVTSTFANLGTLTIYFKEHEVNVRTDRDVLMEFYMHHDGVNWHADNFWNTSQPLSSWFGIQVLGDRVTAIWLPGNNLTGTLFPGLSELTELEYIDLGEYIMGAPPSSSRYNDLEGTLPPEWSSLEHLTFLNLSHNRIEGNIPASWADLESLEVINLVDNQLSGAVPDVIATLETIFTIELTGNQVDYIPNFAATIEANLLMFAPMFAQPGLEVADNKLEFDDLQRQIPDITIYSATFEYNPQAKINTPETMTVLTGRDAILTCITPGTGLTYKWWYCATENGTYTDLTLSVDPEIIGADSPTLTMVSMGSGDVGYYYCKVENANLAPLVLTRETIHLLEQTFDLNNAVPYWYITTATGASTMHNKIMIPELADENGLTLINVYGYDQVTADYTDLLATIPLTGSVTGYEFLDTNSDPNVRAFSYKISVVDDLANESNKSDYQQSVHLAINLGLNSVRNLIWTHYEPGSMVLSYDVMAGNTMDVSTMTSLANLPKFLNSYTDYGTWNYYVIQTNFVPPPTPMKNGYEFSSISNILATQGLPEAPSKNDILVYPNPVNSLATLSFENPDNLEYTLTVSNINGQIVRTIENITTNILSLNVNDLPEGLYILQLMGDHSCVGKMIVK